MGIVEGGALLRYSYILEDVENSAFYRLYGRDAASPQLEGFPTTWVARDSGADFLLLRIFDRSAGMSWVQSMWDRRELRRDGVEVASVLNHRDVRARRIPCRLASELHKSRYRSLSLEVAVSVKGCSKI